MLNTHFIITITMYFMYPDMLYSTLTYISLLLFHLFNPKDPSIIIHLNLLLLLSPYYHLYQDYSLLH